MTASLVLLLALAAQPSHAPGRVEAPDAPDARGAPEDVRGALAALEAETASERLAAQRWLAARLEADDLPLVAEVAAGAGLEVRTRLIAALGADDRHLGLAALLATDHDATLRLVGRSAVRKMILRWYEDDTLTPQPMESVEVGLAGRFAGQLFSLNPRGKRIDNAVDLLARNLGTPLGLQRGSVGIALDPTLYVQSAADRDPRGAEGLRPVAGPARVGASNELLFSLLRERGLTLESFAFEGQRAWLHVVDPSSAGTQSADELLGRWVREVLESTSRLRGAGAARALAGSGWPAALVWLEERWLLHGDANAFSGLLLAAGRGRVAPSLARAGVVQQLLADGDRLLVESAGDPARWDAAQLVARQRVAELKRALAAVGPIGTDGADLTRVVAAGWDEATGAQRNFRMAVLAGMGRAPEELLERVRTWLGTEPGGPTDLQRYGALRLLAAVEFARARRPEPLVVERAFELYELAGQAGSLGAFDGWLRRAGGVPPPAWADPSMLPASMSAPLRTRVLLWHLDAEGPGPTSQRHLLALTAADGGAHEEAVGEMLHQRATAGGGGELQALFSQAAVDLDEAGVLRLQRVALLAGILHEGLHVAMAERLLSTSALADNDLLLVGALCSGPAGDIVRPALYAAVQQDAGQDRGAGLEAPWVRAAERAIHDLSRANQVHTEKGLQRDLRKLLLGSRHPLVKSLQDDSWPRPPGALVVPLESLNWRLGP